MIALQRKNITPSYKQGFARSKRESAYPGLWRGMFGAWIPALGVTGDQLRDVVGINNGTLQDMDPATDWVSSERGWVLDYAGDDDYVLVNTPVPTGSLSYSVWMNARATVTAIEYIMGVQDSGNPGSRFLRYRGDLENDRLEWQVIADDASAYNAFSVISSASWHHVVGVLDVGASLISFYVDGVLADSTSTGVDTFDTQIGPVSDRLKFGRRPDTATLFFDGKIGDAIIWDRALTANEVSHLYVDHLAPFRRKAFYFPQAELVAGSPSSLFLSRRSITPSYKQGFARSKGEAANPGLWKGLVGAWAPSLGVTGLTLHDVSGRGNDGTLTNMVLSDDWVIDERGWALDFDNTDDFVDIGTNSLLTSGSPFSVSWWENVTDDTGSYPSRFVLQMNGTTNTFLIFRVKSDANFTYLAWGKAPGSVESIQAEDVTSPANSVGTWKHFVITGIDPNSTTPGDFAIYEDASAKTASAGGNFNAETGNRFGAGVGNDETNARLNDILLYDRELTPSEVSHLYVDQYALWRKRSLIIPGEGVAAAAVSMAPNPLNQRFHHVLRG